MRLALDEAQKTKRTSHPIIADVWIAQRINGLLGFGIMAPWQVKDLTDEWLDALDALAEDRQRRMDEEQARVEFERVLKKRRASHPTYRKY